MWEIIKTILSAAKDGFNLFKNTKDRINAETKSNIGYDLFMLYTQINDLLIIGDRIVNYLETFSAADLSNIADADDSDPSALHPYIIYTEQNDKVRVGLYLQALISSQLRNIELIIHLVGQLRMELSVVDGTFRRKITEMVTEKELRLISSSIILLKDDDFKSYVPIPVEFSQEQQKIVKDYLRDSEPKKRLDEIQELLEHFRETLEKNFSITDILVKVRDKDHRTITSLLLR